VHESSFKFCNIERIAAQGMRIEPTTGDARFRCLNSRSILNLQIISRL
jgi:hypothetical protein